jgi:hypothetical protein
MPNKKGRSVKNTPQENDQTMSTANQNYITPSDFKAWQKVNAAMLRDNEDRQRAAAEDAVIKSVMRAMYAGLGLQEAGDHIVRGFQYGCREGISYTPATVRRALRTIGWLPKRERAAGGGAE